MLLPVSRLLDGTPYGQERRFAGQFCRPDYAGQRGESQALSTKCEQRGGTAYRYGGKELAAILTDTNKKGIMYFAESMRQEVEKLSFEGSPDFKVSVSLGIALAPGDGNTFEKLLKNADAALYRAKREGRNRVRSAS
jgi:diguanylate cyclase (GGDEF)-like protein